MSELIETYAEQQELEAQEYKDTGWALATVDSVDSDGVTLIFPGESASGGKKYKRNRNPSVTFSAGQRVLLAKVSGTYVVVCRVG